MALVLVLHFVFAAGLVISPFQGVSGSDFSWVCPSTGFNDGRRYNLLCQVDGNAVSTGPSGKCKTVSEIRWEVRAGSSVVSVLGRSEFPACNMNETGNVSCRSFEQDTKLYTYMLLFTADEKLQAGKGLWCTSDCVPKGSNRLTFDSTDTCKQMFPQAVTCPAGNFIKDSATNECTPCPLGQYQDEANQNECKNCPSGSTTNTAGAVSLRDCHAQPSTQTEVSMSLQYELSNTCSKNIESTVTSEVKTGVAELGSEWSGICADSACSNTNVSTTCTSTYHVVSNTTITGVLPVLTSSGTDTVSPPKEVFQREIAEGDAFQPQTEGTRLQRNRSTVSVGSQCKPGYVERQNVCGAVSVPKDDSLAGGIIAAIVIVPSLAIIVTAGVLIYYIRNDGKCEKLCENCIKVGT